MLQTARVRKQKGFCEQILHSRGLPRKMVANREKTAPPPVALIGLVIMPRTRTAGSPRAPYPRDLPVVRPQHQFTSPHGPPSGGQGNHAHRSPSPGVQVHLLDRLPGLWQTPNCQSCCHGVPPSFFLPASIPWHKLRYIAGLHQRLDREAYSPYPAPVFGPNPQALSRGFFPARSPAGVEQRAGDARLHRPLATTTGAGLVAPRSRPPIKPPPFEGHSRKRRNPFSGSGVLVRILWETSWKRRTSGNAAIRGSGFGARIPGPVRENQVVPDQEAPSSPGRKGKVSM